MSSKNRSLKTGTHGRDLVWMSPEPENFVTIHFCWTPDNAWYEIQSEDPDSEISLTPEVFHNLVEELNQSYADK